MKIKSVAVNLYIVFLSLFLLFLVQSLFKVNLQVDSANASSARDYIYLERKFDQILTSTEQKSFDGYGTQLGKAYVCEFTISGIHDDYNSVMFYTRNGNVRVFIGDESVYSAKVMQKHYKWNRPGSYWNELFLTPEMNGKVLRIEVYPSYEYTTEERLKLYIGNYYDMRKNIVWNSLPSLLAGIVCIVIGVGMLAYFIGNYAHLVYKSVAFAAAFYILAGGWKLCETDIFSVARMDYPVFSMLGVWLVSMLPIAFTLTIEHYFLRRKSKLFWIPSNLSILAVIYFVLGTPLDIVNTKTVLIVNEICLLSAIVVSAGYMGYLICMEGIHEKNWLSLSLAGSALLWLLPESLSFLAGREMLALIIPSKLAFVLHAGLLAYHGLLASRANMEVGMYARRYEKIAYYDALTGFYNKSAFLEFIENAEFNPIGYAVGIFDLNNLKVCNDTAGHENGDLYIKESARIIRESFGDIGQCYRIGGDEMCILFRLVTREKFESRKQILLEKVKEFNSYGFPFDMGIACGYAEYEPGRDRSFEETMKRADKNMYEMKYHMKNSTS